MSVSGKDLDLEVEPHPLLDLVAFVTELRAPVAALVTPPEVVRCLSAGAEAPVSPDESVRPAIRALLRHGGFKPSGRSKPASEYLAGAAAEGPLRSINPVVDVCNAVSLHSGVPISLVDLGKADAPLRVAIAPAGTRYVFNPSGQVIDVGGLLCLFDVAGPCANAVKDAQRSKTDGETRTTLTLLWSSNALGGRAEASARWYRELLAPLGTTHAVEPRRA